MLPVIAVEIFPVVRLGGKEGDFHLISFSAVFAAGKITDFLGFITGIFLIRLKYLPKQAAMYEVIVDRPAEKDIEKPPKIVVKKIIKALTKLATDPKPIGVKKLSGINEDLYRIRLGDYRIIYAIKEGLKIDNVRTVRHRKDVYRSL